MKTNLFRYILLFVAAVPVISCETEDGFYNEKYIDTTQVVSFSTETEFAVNDYLFVGAEIPRVIPENGFADPIDLFASTSGSDAFTFSYVLEKQSTDGNWEYVSIPISSLNVTEGSAQSGSFVLAHAEFDAVEDQYEYAAGLQLTTPGTYRLSFGINSDAANQVEFRSNSPENALNVNLISTISGLSNTGFHVFTVL